MNTKCTLDMKNFLYKETPIKKKYLLKVDEIHSIYVSHYGSENKPVVFFIHGGPGSSTEPICARFFNPLKYHIILFDQRGCGKSKPLGELKNNKTKYLIDDIEKIRLHNKFKKIILFGGSWGASLSLLYAIKYPQNVQYYIIRGFCLLNTTNYNIFTESIKEMYPELWSKFISLSKYKKTIDICKEYHYNIKRGNKKYINTWYNLESNALTINPINSTFNESYKTKKNSALLESYYYSNNFFIPSNFFIKNINKIKHIPGTIIHGRLDVICNLSNSYKISLKLPKTKLKIIENAGHSFNEPLITEAIVKETDNYLRR